jgi:hypothetical protein
LVGLLLIAAAVAAALLAAASLRLASLVSTLLAAYVFLAGGVVLLVLVLSPLRWLTRAGLAVAEIVVLAVALAAWWLRGRPRLPLAAARRAGRLLVSDPLMLAFLIVVGCALAYELVLALTVPPNNNDALTYHLARAAAWVQHGGYHWIANAPAPRMNEYEPVAEQEIAYVLAATGTAALTVLPQYLAQLAIVIAVYGAARRLGAGIRPAATCALLTMTFSLFALEASTAQNDLVAASFPAAALCLLLGGGWSELVLAGVALGIGVGVKLTVALALPVIIVVLASRGRRALALVAAGGVAGFVLVGMWGYVLNLQHTGRVLGYGVDRAPFTTAPSVSQDLQTSIHVLYQTFDLSVLSYRAVYAMAIVGTVAGVAAAVAVRSRRRGRLALAVGAGVALPFFAPLLTIGGAHTVAFVDHRLGYSLNDPVFGGSMNRSANEDSSAFGPLGALFVVGTPVVAGLLYVARRLDLPRLALGLAVPVFAILVALKARYYPWQTRYLLVPVALSAPLFASVLRRRSLAWSALIVGAVVVALTLTHDLRKPLESRNGSPWQLTWSKSLSPRGGDPFAGVLDSYERIVPRRACVGAVLGPDDPTFLLFGEHLEHRVVFLPPQDALIEAYRRHLFYVVVGTRVDTDAVQELAHAGWKLRFPGPYWQLLVSPARGAASGRCTAV